MSDRDDFSLPSTVGTSTSGVGGPVIKIILGGDGGQVRRVPAHRLVKNGKPAYSLLLTLISRYAFPDKAIARNCDVVTTYLDEDGDTITISTDEELEDALAMVVVEAGEGKKQVLRINAIAKERADKNEEDNAETAKDEPPCSETVAAVPCRSPSERKLAGGRRGKLQWDLLAVGDGELDADSKVVADRLVKDIVDSISLKSEAAPAKAEEEGEDKKEAETVASKNSQETDAAESKAKAEPVVFIHARHTCDGCGVTPIMGTRFHASDRVDYDLCQGCFLDPSVGASDHKKFVTEELDRDRAMQHRWARRHAHGRFRGGRGRRCQRSRHQHHRQAWHCPVAPAQQNFAEDVKMAVEHKEDDSDKELQEAVLRSMQAFKDDMVEEKEAKKEGKEKEGEPAPSAEEGQGEPAPSAEEDEGEPAPSAVKDESTPTPSAEEDVAASWRGVAESFSSANAGSGDFADVLGAVASVVASEMEKHADVVADATRSAGSMAADTTRSASTGPVPNGIAAAITAAMNASRMASTVASEVKAAIDKELQKKAEEGPSAAFGAGNAASPMEEDEVPDIPADPMEEEEIVIEAKDEATKDMEEEEEIAFERKEGELEDEASKNAKGEEEIAIERKEGEFKNETSKVGEDLKMDDASEKSEWEDVGAENKEAAEASDDNSLGSSSSGIAPPVLARWAEQLKVLRQLGFTDDRKSVDALETLQAANLGVDSTDEVTVGDCVNYLLKNVE